MVFNVDSSASVGDADFAKVKKWIQNLVSTFEIGPDKTRVGVVVFSDKPTMAISLNEFHEKESLLKNIQNLRFDFHQKLIVSFQTSG